MPYTPTYADWKNYPDVTTPITEAALDNMQTQYTEAVADMGFTLVNTEVFAGNSPNPNAWTNLDITAVVGAKPAVVWFRVQNATGATSFGFRPNGETELARWEDDVSPSNSKTPGAGAFALTVCPVVAGIVEWYCDGPGEAVTIDVIAYTPNKS